MEKIPINIDKDGCSFSIVRNYQKNKDKIGRRLGGGYQFTGVMEIVYYETRNKDALYGRADRAL